MGIEMAVIAGLASAGSGLLSVMQQQQQAEAEQDFLKSQEAMARQQAEEEVQRANRIAESQEIEAIEMARRQRLKDKQAIARQRAFQATSGVSQTEGSPLKIDESNLITSALNMNDIFDEGLARGAETRYAGQQAKRGLLFEADQLRFQRKLSQQKAKNQMITGIIGAGASGLGAFAGAGGSFGGATTTTGPAGTITSRSRGLFGQSGMTTSFRPRIQRSSAKL